MSVTDIAAASASFGVGGPPGDGTTAPLSPQALLEAISAAGYAGTELPPPGTFGTPAQLAYALSAHGLRAVGAYVPLDLAGDEASFEASLSRLRDTLAELSAAGPHVRAVLADAGAPELRHRLAVGARGPRLDDDGWSRLSERVHQAVRIAAEQDVDASFHPHLATHVETADEIDRLLETVPVGLTLDTAHLALAGADVAAVIRRHATRIDHVHLKDAQPEALAAVQRARRTDFLAWWPTLFAPLGRGALDIEGAVSALLQDGYRGWMVIEQDRAPFAPSGLQGVIAEEAASRQWLEEVLARAQRSMTTVAAGPSTSGPRR